ncbi:unnamed protein product [marine sediment metagenome]|uniref:NADH:flavin oxidoreductase/NADH oxidase N-terminal domain-containing protein n=1 Tax=marine sediment metagenome TaxID=412755 RepID=X1NWC9_9ZZZZ
MPEGIKLKHQFGLYAAESPPKLTARPVWIPFPRGLPGAPQAPQNLTNATFTPAVLEELTAGIKKVVTVPVIAVGKITPEAGERMLEEKKADLIAIGKALLADPEFLNKVASGRLEDITPCIGCMECRDDLRNPEVIGIRCQVNAALGREEESKIVPAKKSRVKLGT